MRSYCRITRLFKASLLKKMTVFEAENFTIIHRKVAAGKKLATDFVQKCSKDFALT